MNAHELTTKTLEHQEIHDVLHVYYPDLFKKSRLQVNKLWQVLFDEVCPYYYAIKIIINNSNEFLLEIMTFYGHWFSLIRQKLLQNDRIHFIFN